MAKLKHSKAKNTGLIFEILVKQIASDTLLKKDSPAIGILKKFYTGASPLVKEFKIYQLISKSKNLGSAKAETILSTIAEAASRLDRKALKESKYNLIAEINRHYKIDEFFAIQVPNYKPLAALYCLMEAYSNEEYADPENIVSNKTTLLEHLSTPTKTAVPERNAVTEEFLKCDKEIQMLAFKILLEKFNTKYDNLLPEQKLILKEYITATDSTVRLKNYVNEELNRVSKELALTVHKVQDDIVKIKIEEIRRGIKPLSAKDKVSEKHLIGLMQYYNLLHELKSVK